MIPAEAERLWEDYLASEQVRVRQRSLEILERFITVLLQQPAETWHPWARQLARRVVDEHAAIPVRLPLFRAVLFPALLAGLDGTIQGSARWLSGFSPLLHKFPLCCEQLPEDGRSEYGLLLRALRDDPDDLRTKKTLCRWMRNRFDYALHELPSGVLYGHDGASADECREMMAVLAIYERLAGELGLEKKDRELIAEARFHLPAYQRYLSKHEQFADYESYLSACHDR